MALLREGTVGILPAGALGAAFFFHLTKELRAIDGRVSFVSREGSASSEALRASGKLRFGFDDKITTVVEPAIWKPDLLSCAKSGSLPEVLLVCTQPDQLLGVVSTCVRLLEYLHELNGVAGFLQLPNLVLCSNGIYFQRVRQFLVEKLEEATLFGRLPDLWPEVMPQLVGKLLRGVTIQTSQREGSGPEAIYRPGLRGRTRIAGGSDANRQRCADLLTSLGGWFEVAGHFSPTRVEFDKALVNLTVNLLGQLHAIDDHGRFRLLTIREILASQQDDEIRDLASHMLEVGRAVRAYDSSDTVAALIEQTFASCRGHLDHIPSSLQWIQQQLQHGKLEARLTPTESWLLDPLIRYAHAAGLDRAAHYFEDLTHRVQERLARSAPARSDSGEAARSS